jgi:hypothetical protein
MHSIKIRFVRILLFLYLENRKKRIQHVCSIFFCKICSKCFIVAIIAEADYAQIFREACFVIMRTELPAVCQVPSAFLLTRKVPLSSKYGTCIIWSLYVSKSVCEHSLSYA